MRLRNELAEILGGWHCQNPDCQVPGGCTDKRCLQFEHRNGDGYKDRRRFRGNNAGSKGLMRYYLNHPDEARRNLQIYCANCNQIKKIDNKEFPNLSYILDS